MIRNQKHNLVKQFSEGKVGSQIEWIILIHPLRLVLEILKMILICFNIIC